MERSVDMETFLSLEKETFFPKFIKKAEPLKQPNHLHTFIQNNGFPQPRFEKETKVEPVKNPFTQKEMGQLDSKILNEEKKDGLMGWIEENPGTALLGSLLIAGAGYWLYERYLGKKILPAETQKNKDSKDIAGYSVKKGQKRSIKPGIRRFQNDVEVNVNVEPEEFEENQDNKHIGEIAAATIGGIVAGNVLPGYRIIAAVSTGIYAFAKNDITIGCVSAGLLLSPLVAEIVKGMYNCFTGKKQEPKGNLTGHHLKEEKEPKQEKAQKTENPVLQTQSKTADIPDIKQTESETEFRQNSIIENESLPEL